MRGFGFAARCLIPDGTGVVTQVNGHVYVCFLKLHHGQCRVSLAEAEALLSGLRPTRSAGSDLLPETGNVESNHMATSSPHALVEVGEAELLKQQYQVALRDWKALPFWKRLVSRHPQPPVGQP